MAKTLSAAALLGAVLFLAPTLAEGQGLGFAPDGEIGRLCHKQWPDDYAMELHCNEQQSEAFISFVKAIANAEKAKISKNVRDRVLAKCVHDWYDKTIEAMDYRMGNYCYERQLAAAKRLGY